MPAYDPQNPFAKLLRGEFPSYKVYENEYVLAFLDIMPRAPGHTLVIPKAPARNILDIKPDDYAHVARAAHKIAAAAMKAFKADGITVQQFNEPAGGQVVFHLHMHVMPRHNGVALLPPGWGLPLVMLPLVFITLGVCWIISSLGVYVRDIGQLIGVFTSFIMFMSPIFYPVESLPKAFQAVLNINPLTFIIQQARSVMIDGRLPTSP